MQDRWSILPRERRDIRLSSRKVGFLSDPVKGSFGTLFSNLPLTLLLFDSSLKLIYANKNLHQEFNRDPSLLLHKSIEKILPPKIIGEIGLKNRIQSIFENRIRPRRTALPPKADQALNMEKKGKQFEGQLEYQNGSVHRIYHYQLLSIPGSDRKHPIGMLLLDNITERLTLQRTIVQERRRLKEIFDGMEIGLVIINKDLKIEMVNKAARSLLGFASKERLRGRKYPQQFFKKNTYSTGCPIAETFKTGESSYHPNQDLEVDGSRRIFEIHTFPLKDRRGKVTRVVECIRDVTEERVQEENLRNMEKLASVGQLAAGLAHELGNPLGIIAGTAQFCLQNRNAYDGLRKSFEVILRNAQNADRIIKELLRYTRPSETLFMQTQIPLLVKRACFLVETETKKKRIKIEEHHSPRLPSIWADEHQLVQILVNLLLNSIEACKRGGKITITTSLKSNKKRIVLRIMDDGPGFPAEYLEKVFDPFFTTRPHGTGLGLSICRNIICSHKGSITAENRRGRGAKVTLTLPANQKKNADIG